MIYVVIKPPGIVMPDGQVLSLATVVPFAATQMTESGQKRCLHPLYPLANEKPRNSQPLNHENFGKSQESS